MKLMDPYIPITAKDHSDYHNWKQSHTLTTIRVFSTELIKQYDAVYCVLSVIPGLSLQLRSSMKLCA